MNERTREPRRRVRCMVAGVGGWMMLAGVAGVAAGQDAAAKPTDSIVFENGERLTGELEAANKDGVTFKSAEAGEIKVAWSKIKTLDSDKQFAVIPADKKLTRRAMKTVVPSGPLQLQGGSLEVGTGGGVVGVPIASVRELVTPASFDKAVNHPPNFLHGWTGAVSAGASFVRATQDSTTFTGAINLVRAVPQVDWLPTRNRTLVDYSQAYGTQSQVGQTTIKTNIFHAGAERDEYLSQRVYAFATTAFDHNFSQGLDLQQQYGGGLGATLISNAVQQLDVKGDVHYEKQQFFSPASNLNLFGSTFAETYLRNLPRKIVFNEFGSISPAWNQLDAYSARLGANLVFPVYKGFAFNVGATDDYLNNAPAGFKKNSVTFTSGITYSFAN